MKNKIRRLLSKKGLSLIEVIIALFISSILILCATGMLAPVNSLLNTTKTDAHLDAANNTLNEYIRRSVQASQYLAIVPIDNTDKLADKIIEYQGYVNTELQLKALAIIKKTDTENGVNIDRFRLYEFDSVNGTSDFTNPSDEINGVFNPDFYEKASYLASFENASPEDLGEGGSKTTDWLKINSVFVRNGDYVSQLRKLSFKVLGGNVNFGGNNSAKFLDSSDNLDISAYCDGVVILYIKKDYSTYKSSLH